jgi:hypothetical protein
MGLKWQWYGGNRRTLCPCSSIKSTLYLSKEHWEDGIRMDLGETGLVGCGLDWIRLAQDRDRWRAVVSAVMNLRVVP